MKKKFLNKNVIITCIDNQIIKGKITEWEDDHIDVNISIEIPLKEIKEIRIDEEIEDYVELTKAEKALIHIMAELDIGHQTAVAICLLLRKRNIRAELLIKSLRNLEPEEITDEKIIDLALNLKSKN